MKYLLMCLLFLAGCSGSGTLSTGIGSASRQDIFEMSAAYEAYYMAIMEQQKAIEIVKIELDENGRVKSFAVNQVAPFQEIQVPKKSYSPGWETANRFVDGLWGTVKFAVPGATAWAVADSIGRIADRPSVTNSYNSAGNDYAGAGITGPTSSNSSINDSYSPTDSSNNSVTNTDNSNNSVDSSNQGNPIDNSNQGNPINNSNNSSVPAPVL